MQQHTVLGERILSASPALRLISGVVRSSHERWDGHGYPDGLKETEIPLGSRIVAVCDAYEVMTTDRCYRKRLGHEVACQELARQAGKQFDPDVVEALLAELQTDGAVPETEPLGLGQSTQRAMGVAFVAPEALGAQRADAVAGYLREALKHQEASGHHPQVHPVGLKAR
jgi:hypothetical protein